MLAFEILAKIRFCLKADRLGPDIPFTHWMLHFASARNRLCRKKFARFAEGADFRAGAYAVFCSRISIGKRVVVRPGSMLFADQDAGIEIQDDVMMGAGVHFYVNNHRFDRTDVPLIDQGYYPSEGIRIETGAWIGANAILLPGVVIGRNAVVGAGSVVTKSVPDFSVAVGSPARVIRTLAAARPAADGANPGTGA
jgi:acetyltransferase-like isoleucine patch superfamily enzyme